MVEVVIQHINVMKIPGIAISWILHSIRTKTVLIIT